MDISPDIESRLRLRAAAQGVSLEDYLRSMMERDILAHSPGRDYSTDEIQEMLQSDKITPDLEQKFQRLLTL